MGEDGDDTDAFEEVVLNGRMCIVSRERLPAEELIRFVADPQGRVVADLRRRLPGRGAHVEARRSSVEKAVARKLFRRALKGEVEAGSALPGEVDEALVRSVLGALGLARKAGQIVTGAAKVEAQLRSGRAVALVQASDAAADGLRKMDGARHAGEVAHPSMRCRGFRLLPADELGLALGQGNVVHAAVLAGSAGTALVMRLEALERYRDESPERKDGRAASAGPSGSAPTIDEGHPDRDALGRDFGGGSSAHPREAEA